MKADLLKEVAGENDVMKGEQMKTDLMGRETHQDLPSDIHLKYLKENG